MLDITHVSLLFSFTFQGIVYPCALVHWFQCVGEAANKDTSTWVVEHELDEDGQPITTVLHLDTIICTAHVIGVYRTTDIDRSILPEHSLNIFCSYYMNRFIDHHVFEIAF